MRFLSVHRYYDDLGKYVKSKSIVSLIRGVGDTIQKWEKFFGKVDSMASYVNLFTNDNLILYTRVRVCIGVANI
jgi:hypothetical protein